MRMKLWAALGLTLSFFATNSFADPLTAQTSGPEQQAVVVPAERPNLFMQDHNGDPYYRHGYMRSNHHLLHLTPHFSNNFLLGVSGGYARQREQMHMNFTSLPVPGISPGIPNGYFVDHEETITNNGTILGILAGWQWRCRRVMLGIEGSVDFGSYYQNRQFAFTESASSLVFGLPAGITFVSTALYDRGPIYALTGRVGYFVTPFFFPYLRGGVQVSRDEVTLQSFSGRFPVLFPDFPADNKGNAWGGVLGIGLEFPTNIGASTLRVEYNYSQTQTITIDDRVPPVIGSYQFRQPGTNTVKVAWVWNFI